MKAFLVTKKRRLVGKAKVPDGTAAVVLGGVVYVAGTQAYAHEFQAVETYYLNELERATVAEAVQVPKSRGYETRKK